MSAFHISSVISVHSVVNIYRMYLCSFSAFSDKRLHVRHRGDLGIVQPLGLTHLDIVLYYFGHVFFLLGRELDFFDLIVGRDTHTIIEEVLVGSVLIGCQ